MTDRILLIAAACGTLLCLIGVLRAVPIGRRKYCRGQRTHLAEWLSPFVWLARSGCGYDLSAHLGEGRPKRFTITCPECGRVNTRRRELLRRAYRLRIFSCGFLLAASTSAVLGYRFFAQKHWDEDLPTWALVEIERWCGESTPIGVRTRIRRRMRYMDAHEMKPMWDVMITDLRADDQRQNADNAVAFFRSHSSPEIVSALHAVLDSDDHQQRQLAASILRHWNEPPSDELVRVTMEALRFDRESGRYRYDRYNGSSAIAYIRKHFDVFRPNLGSALASSDPQQRQVAAHLLIEADEPPSEVMFNVLVVDFPAGDGTFEGEVSYFLFDDGLMRTVDYFGRSGAFGRAWLRERLGRPGPVSMLAACILREMTINPDDEFLLALVDALRFDPWPTRRWALRGFMIEQTLEYLVDHGPEAAAALQAGMRSDDPQQRLLCAAVAGFGCVDDVVAQAAPILIEHLRDNHVQYDAVFATRALFGFGQAARPFLMPGGEEFDEQSTIVRDYLLRKIDGAPAWLPRRVTRWGWDQFLTDRSNDPVRFDWRDLRVPQIAAPRLADGE